MIPAAVGRANSRRTRRPSQRRTSSRYSAMECSQEFGKSVDFDISVDFGKSADLGKSNDMFNCSQDFHRSQEFGRDRTLSTQGSSSEDLTISSFPLIPSASTTLIDYVERGTTF
eukprot:scaffold5864_cov93-Skeletonema_dohrnii-CCMP3373.AAC.8